MFVWCSKRFENLINRKNTKFYIEATVVTHLPGTGGDFWKVQKAHLPGTHSYMGQIAAGRGKVTVMVHLSRSSELSEQLSKSRK